MHLLHHSQDVVVYQGIKNKDTLTKKWMTVIEIEVEVEETLSEMKAEGQMIDKTTTIDTLFPHATSVIVRPDSDRKSFDWSIQCAQLQILWLRFGQESALRQ